MGTDTDYRFRLEGLLGFVVALFLSSVCLGMAFDRMQAAKLEYDMGLNSPDKKTHSNHNGELYEDAIAVEQVREDDQGDFENHERFDCEAGMADLSFNFMEKSESEEDFSINVVQALEPGDSSGGNIPLIYGKNSTVIVELHTLYPIDDIASIVATLYVCVDRKNEQIFENPHVQNPLGLGDDRKTTVFFQDVIFSERGLLERDIELHVKLTLPDGSKHLLLKNISFTKTVNPWGIAVDVDLTSNLPISIYRLSPDVFPIAKWQVPDRLGQLSKSDFLYGQELRGKNWDLPSFGDGDCSLEIDEGKKLLYWLSTLKNSLMISKWSSNDGKSIFIGPTELTYVHGNVKCDDGEVNVEKNGMVYPDTNLSYGTTGDGKDWWIQRHELLHSMVDSMSHSPKKDPVDCRSRGLSCGWNALHKLTYCDASCLSRYEDYDDFDAFVKNCREFERCFFPQLMNLVDLLDPDKDAVGPSCPIWNEHYEIDDYFANTDEGVIKAHYHFNPLDPYPVRNDPRKHQYWTISQMPKGVDICTDASVRWIADWEYQWAIKTVADRKTLALYDSIMAGGSELKTCTDEDFDRLREMGDIKAIAPCLSQGNLLIMGFVSEEGVEIAGVHSFGNVYSQPSVANSTLYREVELENYGSVLISGSGPQDIQLPFLASTIVDDVEDGVLEDVGFFEVLIPGYFLNDEATLILSVDGQESEPQNLEELSRIGDPIMN